MASPFESKEFKALRDAWYAKLEQSGFKDLERPGGSLRDDHFIAKRRRWALEKIQALQDYYDRASEYLWEGKFRNKQEREVWRLHADGKTFTAIAEATGLHRSSVVRRVRFHQQRAGLKLRC